MLDRGPGEIIPHPLGTALPADSGIYPEDNQAGPQLGGSQVRRWRRACWDRDRGDWGLTFDIAMQNPTYMKVFQPLQGLTQVVKGSVFWQTALLLYELA